MNIIKKATVITGKMVLTAIMMLVLIETVGMMIYAIYTGDSRLIGEVSLFACVQTGYWYYTALEKNKRKKV